MHIYLMVEEGHGKTTAAKVFARAVNCLNPKNGEPCNECEICKQILSGSLTDVIEMDAASNNSVEDIRAIRDEVNFLPTVAKYRVYIIDEVHMLSQGAFNALLKTLEEPPEHVKFILATTEPQKLPATILSRCQRFDFKRISNENVIKRLKIVCNESSINITDEALKIIAVMSEGAMRDALTILERCIQDGMTNIDEEKVKELIGIPKLTYIEKIVRGILNYNVEEALQALEEVLQDGKDINNILWEIIKYTKDILVYKTSKNLEIYSQDEIKQIEELEKIASKERLINIIYLLSETENNIKWSSQKVIMLQTGIMKLCCQSQSDGIEELKNRIDILEEKLKNGNFQTAKKETIPIEKKQAIQNQALKATKPKTNLKSEDYWQDVLNTLKTSGKMVLYTNLINTRAVQINDMTVGIEFPNGMTAFGKTLLERPENINELTKLISMNCGKQMNIKYINLKEETKENSIEDMVKDLDIPINIIE